MVHARGRLALVGLGLGPGGVSIAGLAEARAARHVFVETYTGLPPEPLSELERLVGRPVAPLGRAAVEDPRTLLAKAKEGGACLLVPGDPFSATTHTGLRLAARRLGIDVVVHFGASILTAAAGLLGLSHYKFGRATTLVTRSPAFFPSSPYDVVTENLGRGLHSLVLLDIRPDGCMTAAEGAALLLRLAELKPGGSLGPGTLAAAVARVGRADHGAWWGPLGALAKLDAGPPMHTLVVPGALSDHEEEALEELVTPVGDKAEPSDRPS